MAKRYTYEAKVGTAVYCSMAVYDNGKWEFETWPTDVTKDISDSMTESFQRGIDRMTQHGLTKIELKKL